MKLLVDSDVIDIAKGVIRMAVKWNCNYNDTATQNFFNAGTAFRAYYAPALDKIVFDCCGTTISSGTQNFSIGDIYIYHFIWNNYPDENHAPGIYINANLSGTIGAYTTNTMDGNIFIGSNSTYTNQLKGEILDFTIFDVTPTKLQVIADYNQLNEWIRSGDGLGQPRNTIPYISTYGGGGTVNSYYDSTHQDWAICGNIPGNLPARTIFDVSLQLAGTSDAGLVMSNHSYVHYINKADEFYGTDSAGSVGTAWVSYPGTPIEILRDWSAYRGQKVYLSAVLTDAGTVDALGRMRIFYASGVNAYVSETTVLDTTAGGTQWYLLGPMIIPESMPSEYDWMNSYKELNYGFQLNRLTGGGTITMDFYRMLVGQTMYVSFSGMNGSGTQSAIIDGNNVYTYHSGKEDGFRVLYGDIIELEPYRYNHLVALPLKIGRTASTFDTVKFNRVYVIPRYSLL